MTSLDWNCLEILLAVFIKCKRMLHQPEAIAIVS